MPDLVPVDHDPFEGASPFTMSDASRDPIAPGQQYAMAQRMPFPEMSGLTSEIDKQAGGFSRGAAVPGPSATPTRALSLSPSQMPVQNFKASPTDHNFRMISREGKDLGGVSINASDPKNLFVNLIENYQGGGANSIGPSAIRDVLRSLKDHYPGLKKVYGNRVSGGREQAGAPTYAETAAHQDVNPKDLSLRYRGTHSEYGEPEYAGKPYFTVHDRDGGQLGQITAASERDAIAKMNSQRWKRIPFDEGE